MDKEKPLEESLTIRAQVWKAQADDCPARCGCRCNLNGEMCTVDHCFGLYWNGLKMKGTGGE